MVQFQDREPLDTSNHLADINLVNQNVKLNFIVDQAALQDMQVVWPKCAESQQPYSKQLMVPSALLNHFAFLRQEVAKVVEKCNPGLKSQRLHLCFQCCTQKTNSTHLDRMIRERDVCFLFFIQAGTMLYKTKKEYESECQSCNLPLPYGYGGLKMSIYRKDLKK